MLTNHADIDALDGEPLLLTLRQAAALLAVSTRTIQRLIKAGELRTVSFGRRCTRVVYADLAALVELKAGAETQHGKRLAKLERERKRRQNARLLAWGGAQQARTGHAVTWH